MLRGADLELLELCRRRARAEYHADIVILELHRAIYAAPTKTLPV